MKRKLLVAIPLLALIILGSIATIWFLAGKTAQVPQPNYFPVTEDNLDYYTALNHNNSLKYAHDVATACAPAPTNETSNGGGNIVKSRLSTCASLSVETHHKGHYAANTLLLKEGYNASCMIRCDGVYYTFDPTVSIMNCGRDFEQFKIFGAGGSAATCPNGGVYQSADIAQYLSVSTSNTVTTTDTACPATVQTTNGFSIAAGTIVAGVKGATVTTTVAFTWTASAAVGPVSLACLQTEASGGSNIVLYLEGQFGPDTLATNDTLKITASIART